MIWTKEKINEAAYLGVTIWVEDGETWHVSNCCMCQVEFIKEVLSDDEGNSLIPKYCDECMEEDKMMGQKYILWD